MRKVFEFANDWRDTIFYSVVALSITVALLLGVRRCDVFWDAMQIIFMREACRGAIWTFTHLPRSSVGWAAALAVKIYWKDLFDYPRKQKPPKKWDSVGAKVKRWLDKFAPDFVPSPVGCRQIVEG